MSDKELEEWLEKRWMGRYLNVLTDNGWDDLNAIQACGDEEAKSIISLFEKSGHQLKMRILLQELRGTSLEDSSAPPASSSRPTSATSSKQQHDDSDSDVEAPASSDDDDDDEDVPPPKAASPVLPSTNKWGDKVASNNTSTTTSSTSSTPSWMNKSKPTASSPTSPTKTIDHTRKDSDIDLPPAPMGFTAPNKPKSSPTQTTRVVEPQITRVVEPVKPVVVVNKNSDSPTFGSTPPLPPPPNLSGDSGYGDDADDDHAVPPLPDDSSDSSDDEGSGKSSGKSSPGASPPAGPTKASPFSSQPQSTITGNGAKNWGAKPISSPTTTPTPTTGGGIKDRMNALNINSNNSSSSPPLKPQTFGGGGGLKDRMNALQASSTSSATTSKNPAPSIRAGDVQGRIGALAGMIKIQAPGQSHPLFGKTRPQQAQEEVEEDVEGNADPDAGDDYELPPSNALDEPQKEGWLEKRGNGRHREELTQMYVALKDDCLYWLRSTDDQFPTGMICLTEPGLTTTMLEGDELEITSRKRTYRFRAQDADELSGWHSKIRVAKMLHTSGAKPKTSAKAAPHFANQVASKAMGAAFMANKDQHTEAKAYASPKFNQAPQGRIQPGAISNRDEPKRQQQRHDDDDDDDDDDAAPPPAVEDDDDDDDDNDDGIQYSGRGAPQQSNNNRRPAGKESPQTSARAVASPKQSPRKEEEPPEYRRYKDMLKIGSMFQKYKRGKGKKRLIWCPLSLDRILWGDEKKKKVKGYMMVCDIQKVTHGCLGAKKPGNALTIHSTERTLDLEAPDTQQKNDWINAVEMLIETYRR